ncbi:jg15616 [Pararge aegeria aegeria]|uniref:Jg15616 protein n=1 Tax=Pararge aegeria aegeria TaxID=348720 RepID=A0A8S4S0J7_9NEOP|nr:jg15616 [Pararge aegeria aegeria]
MSLDLFIYSLTFYQRLFHEKAEKKAQGHSAGDGESYARSNQEEICRRARVSDIAQWVAKLNTQWARYKARRTDGRWCPKVLEWPPHLGKRSDYQCEATTDDLVG